MPRVLGRFSVPILQWHYGLEANAFTLRPVIDIPTEGNAGFEFFATNGSGYLAAANFWDGVSAHMEAESRVYSVSTKGSVAKGSMTLSNFQNIRSNGAHGVDFFEFRGDRFLVVPNYYGNHVDVYCWSSQVDDFSDAGQEKGGRFRFVGEIAAKGAGQTDFFERDGRGYIVVGENFAEFVSIYEVFKLASSSEIGEPKFQFQIMQQLPTPGAGSIAIADIEQDLFIVACSYFDENSNRHISRESTGVLRNGGAPWATQSLVWRSIPNSGTLSFNLHQRIDTRGCHDAEYRSFEVVGSGPRRFLFLSEDRSNFGVDVHSELFEFDEVSSFFRKVGSVRTDGAHAAELFRIGQDFYVAVANFGDRLAERFEATSKIFRIEDKKDKTNRTLDEDSVNLVEVAAVTSNGATDWEYFEWAGASFIVLSNEGDIQRRQKQVSRLFYIDASPSSDQKKSHKQDLRDEL